MPANAPEESKDEQKKPSTSSILKALGGKGKILQSKVFLKEEKEGKKVEDGSELKEEKKEKKVSTKEYERLKRSLFRGGM